MNFYLSARQYGNQILLRAVEDGRRVKHKVPYSPYLFTDNIKQIPSKYSTIGGNSVVRMDFDSIRDAKEFIGKYEDVSNFNYYGMTNFVYPFLNDEYAGELQFDQDLINIISTDIETMSDDGFPDIKTANKEITAITLSNFKEYVVLTVKDYKPHMKNVRHVKCQDEKELLLRFITEWRNFDPDIITGWNVEGFDIPYLVNRIMRVLGEDFAKQLSPWFIKPMAGEFKRKDTTVQSYDIYGVAIMDYLHLYKKWSFTTQESYKLDHIANVELGVGKVDYSEYGSLHGLYEKNFQLYVEYNIRDTEIINQLEEKLGFISMAVALAYDTKFNYGDVFTSTRMWDVIIHNYLMERDMVIPQYKYDGKPFEFVGGYVKDPINGSHDWVCSFDLNSLYPHLIMQYNISPETYVGKIGIGNDIGDQIDGVFHTGGNMNEELLEYLKEKNLTITPNGCLWTREYQGFLPAILEKMYLDRKSNKDKMLAAQQMYENTHDITYKKDAIRYDKIQMAKKIALNVAYGALGNQYFRWFNPAYAESITKGGQLSIRWIEKFVNEFLNNKFKTVNYDYVIASDTDSIYLRMDNAVKAAYGDNIPSDDEVVKYLDKVCSKLMEPFIDQTYKQLAVNVNAFQQKMKMKREAIASRGIWTGKKHYILNVYNNEGVQYEKPKLKIMGIEAVRSSTPASCRDKIKEGLSIIMNKTEDELIEFVSDFEKEFHSYPFDMVAFPRGLNGIETYFDRNTMFKPATPIHVRGALVYNSILNKRKLTNKLQPLRDGDRLKFCYMRVPNPAMQNVISVENQMPEELSDLNAYIDYDKQFEKAFKVPLKNITDAIGWKLERINTLEAFFV